MHRAACLGLSLLGVSAFLGLASCKGSSSSSGGGASAAPSASASASATPSATPSSTATAVAAAAGPAPVFNAGENWSGGYFCGQGQTSMSLHITRAQPDVGAVFNFSKGAVSGAFMVNGVYSPGTRHLHLAPGNWIHQPPGYVTVALDGEVSADGHSFSGVVQGPGCSGFNVRR
jgi:hypothetical protein